MAYRLTKAERAQIRGNQEILARIARADIIAVQHTGGGEKHAIWRRPLPEVEAGALRAKIEVLMFEVGDDAETEEYRKIIGDLKQPPPSDPETHGTG